MAYMQKVKVAQAQGEKGTMSDMDIQREKARKVRSMGEKGVMTDEGAAETEPAGSAAEIAEGEDISSTTSTPTQAKPKTLEQKSKEPVSGAKVNPAKPQAPSKIKVRSTDDLRSIYKKKFGKSQATIAEGDTVEGEDENYKKIAKQNA